MTESVFNIRGIPAQLVEHFWKLSEPYVKRALDHTTGELTPADIKSLCKDRLVQLWLISEGERVIGCFTTEIVNYPQKRHARIITIGGSRMKDWALQMDIIVCGWAKENGCAAVEAFVRKGFVPILANLGGKHQYSVVVKELPKEN